VSVLISVPCFNGLTLYLQSFALCGSEGLSLVEAIVTGQVFFHGGKIQDAVAHFIFILFPQTSCRVSGEHGQVKSSKEGEL